MFVGDDGIEPSASFLSGKRSTNELVTRCLLFYLDRDNYTSTINTVT